MKDEEIFNEHGWSLRRVEAPLPDGRVKKGVRIRRADATHIIAFTDAGNILILREFRPYYGFYQWMLPSGKADKGGDMQDTAQRELREETGFEAGKMEFLWSGNHTDALDFSNHVFVAHDLKKNPLPQDPDELIEVHEMPITEALEKVLTSQKVHLMSAYGLMRYMRENPR